MGGYGYSNGYGMMGGYSPFAGLLMFIFWLLILVAIGLLVLWAIRQSRHGDHMAPPMSGPVAGPPSAVQQHDEAMAIARKRLATGEITRAQFDEIRQALGG